MDSTRMARAAIVRRQLMGAASIAAVALGCSGKPGRVSTPDVDAEGAAELAMKELDRNSDGQLDREELKASPPLTDALPAYDADRSGALSQAEIAAGIAHWSQRGVGATALAFTVRMDGRALGGAQVKLIPAPFLGDAISPARGVADEGGSGSLDISGEDRPSNAPKNLPVIQPGLYRVEITHPTREIPAKYNTATTLGLEASMAGQNPAGVVWSLTSK